MTEPKHPTSTDEVVETELLGSGPHYTLTEVATRAGVRADDVHTFWRTLGFADVAEDDACFTDSDIAAVKAMGTAVLHDQISYHTSQNLIRAHGHSMDRLVLWQV